MKAIFERVSIRRYQDRPVEREKILALLRAAMAAPSAANQQPWEFYVVTDREKILALSAVTPHTRFATEAPVVIVPVYRTSIKAPSYAQIDMSIALENLWLSCSEQGLGGVWMGIAPIESYMKQVEDILQIREGLRAFALFPLGYPAEERSQIDRYDESRIHFC